MLERSFWIDQSCFGNFFREFEGGKLDFYNLWFFQALSEESEEADAKAKREDVLNQLLVLLNTSLAEKKQEIIVETTEGTAGKEDDIEYNLGFLGLVPATEDEEEG